MSPKFGPLWSGDATVYIVRTVLDIVLQWYADPDGALFQL